MASSRKILLIDYDPESIESTRGPLVRAGYEVEVASDGIAGIEAFERLNPDLVLIEPMVPKKHGFQVCQEIKSTPAGRDTPVLITTGFYRGRKHRAEAHESYGCDDYLEKPIAEELLLSTCKRFLIDTQEPPIPVSDERGTSIPLEIPASELPSAVSGSNLVDSLPDLPIPGEKQPTKLQALDDLTEDEIQERLDAMIIGSEPTPAAETPAAETPVVEMPEPVISEVPEAPVEHPPDEIVPVSVVTPKPVPEPLPASPEVEPSTAETSEATVESLLSRQPAHRPAPAAEEKPAPAAGPDVTSHSAVESSARSRLPLWIGIAAGLFIVVGISILWILRDQGDADTSIDTASIAFGQGSPSSSLEPTNPLPLRLPTVPAPEVGESDLAGEAAVGPKPEEVVVSDRHTAEPLEAPAAASMPAKKTPIAPEPRQTMQPATTKTSPASPPVDRTEAVRGREVEAEDGLVAASTAAAVTTETSPKSAAATEDTIAGGATEPENLEPDPETAVEVDSAESAISEPVIEQTPPTTSPVVPAVVPSPIVPVLIPEEATTSAQPVTPPAPKTRRGDLVDLAELDRAPAATDKPMPEYPPGALTMRLEGTVKLRLLVDERGRVERVEIESGTKSKQLQRAAMKAAERWVYEPGVKDGVAVKVWVPAAVNFKL